MSSAATTALYPQHLQLQAKMGLFAGHLMPLQYSSVKEEVWAVRQRVGVFDVSHMGVFMVEGPNAFAFVNYLVTNDIMGPGPGKAVYSPICRPDGTVIDDLIVYLLAPEQIMICVNAANIEKDWQWFSDHLHLFPCQLHNLSADYSLLAIQGPQAAQTMQVLELLPSLQMAYYKVAKSQLQQWPLIIARTGYTGEDGFEIFGPHQAICDIWQHLARLSVMPCGLVARDVLRLEVAFPLYGHELSDKLTPLDSGLKWTVKLQKKDFIGKDFLQSYKPRYRLIKLSLEKGVPREGYPVLNGDGATIGIVTSGGHSVVLNRGIALALVEIDHFSEQRPLLVMIRQQAMIAQYHPKPFVQGGHL